MNFQGGPGERVFLQTPDLLVTTVRIAITGGATFPTAHVTTVQPRYDEKRWGWLWCFIIGGLLEFSFLANCADGLTTKGSGSGSFGLATLCMLLGGPLIFLGRRLPRAFFTVRVTVGPTWTQLHRGRDRAVADQILIAVHAAVGQRW
jgi:hypothetical protein